MSENDKLKDVKKQLGRKLLSIDELRPRPGVPTGLPSLDSFLLWNGLPKGEICLFHGHQGLGATSLWTQTALTATRNHQWAAWVNSAEASLCPWRLQQQGCDFSKLLVVSPPKDLQQGLWALQELMSLSLFSLIGWDIREWTIRERHLMQLKQIARRYQTSVVLLHESPLSFLHSQFALVVKFQKNQIAIERALHRPTPYLLQRSDIYADLMPQFAKGRKALCG